MGGSQSRPQPSGHSRQDVGWKVLSRAGGMGGEGDQGASSQGLPAWVNSLDALVIDPDVAPQAGGGTEGALAQATGELFH